MMMIYGEMVNLILRLDITNIIEEALQPGALSVGQEALDLMDNSLGIDPNNLPPAFDETTLNAQDQENVKVVSF